MELLTHQLLEEVAVQTINSKLLDEKLPWEEGKKTAGSYASLVKNNFQLARESKTSKELTEEIIIALEQDQLIKSFALPKRFHGLIFSRSYQGQGYGSHVDNAYMSSGRSDLSFTLFLNSPNEYKGGELCIQTMQDKKEIKLQAGQIIIYPSTSLHSVSRVSSGTRLVCVGWIESYIAANEDRNLLFSLDAGARGLLAKHGQSAELDLVFQAYNNLLRRLGS